MAYKIYKISDCTTVDYAAEELKKYLRMMLPECGDIDIAQVASVADDPCYVRLECKIGYKLFHGGN